MTAEFGDMLGCQDGVRPARARRTQGTQPHAHAREESCRFEVSGVCRSDSLADPAPVTRWRTLRVRLSRDSGGAATDHLTASLVFAARRLGESTPRAVLELLRPRAGQKDVSQAAAGVARRVLSGRAGARRRRHARAWHSGTGRLLPISVVVTDGIRLDGCPGT